MWNHCYAVLPDGVAVRSQISPEMVDRPFHDHRFGGVARHRGSVPPGGDKPVLLLFDLDLRDPSLFLTLPAAQRLPLYSVLRYDSSPMIYQVVSDDEICIIQLDEGRAWTPEFPFPAFPESLPEMGALIGGPVRLDYDSDAEEKWEVFWWDGQEPDAPPGPHELVLLDANVYQEWNDGDVPCQNPGCGHGRTDLIAVFHGEPFAFYGIFLWNDGEDKEPDVVIRYRHCPKCHAIDVANLTN